jgi:hypothetical protein
MAILISQFTKFLALTISSSTYWIHQTGRLASLPALEGKISATSVSIDLLRAVLSGELEGNCIHVTYHGTECSAPGLRGS